MSVSREPAIWVGVIGSILTSAAALELSFLNAGQASAIVAALTAIVIAVRTRPVAPAIFTGALSAGVALLAEYQVHLSDAWVGLLTSIVLGVCVLLGIRPQVNPTTASGRVIEGEVLSTATVSR